MSFQTVIPGNIISFLVDLKKILLSKDRSFISLTQAKVAFPAECVNSVVGKLKQVNWFLQLLMLYTAKFWL